MKTNVNIVIGGAVYQHADEGKLVGVVMDIESLDAEDPAGPQGPKTRTRYILSHEHACQMGALLLQHAGPAEDSTDVEEN